MPLNRLEIPAMATEPPAVQNPPQGVNLIKQEAKQLRGFVEAMKTVDQLADRLLAIVDAKARAAKP